MAAEIIVVHRWLYTLYKLANGSIVLSVLCGRAAMYELNILLGDEVSVRAVQDEKFLERLAREVHEHPEQYAGQSISL